MNEYIQSWFAAHSGDTIRLAQALWEKPELPMAEFSACRLTADYMRSQGFQVRTYHCKDDSLEPNTVIATWGSGKPVIGIIGEYDALPELGQDACAVRSPRPGAGHGCGHCLTTPACCTAAVAAKAAMEAEGLTGTIKFMACPAEESGEGKVYMKQRGEFDDLDCCVSWHPMNYDLTPTEGALLALCNLDLEYTGKAAHAAAMPEMGRSALDAAELTNIGVQYLREHVTDDVRMHYVYTNGGAAANVVPDKAALHYILRAGTLHSLQNVLERVKKVARGAAMMTETEVTIHVRSISSETFIVHSFNRFCFESVQKVPAPVYTPEEKQFADELYRNVMGKEPAGAAIPTGFTTPTGITGHVMASTDVGYLTHDVPTCRLFGWGMLNGVPVHHWGITAGVGTAIGQKAAVQAGQAVAQCIYDILCAPDQIQVWKDELARTTASDEEFIPIYPGQE